MDEVKVIKRLNGVGRRQNAMAFYSFKLAIQQNEMMNG